MWLCGYIGIRYSKIQIFWSTRGGTLICSKNRDSRHFFPDEGHHPTKNHTKPGKNTNCLKRFQRKWVLLGVYGWIKRSLTFWGLLVIQETPRNKYFGGDLGFWTSTLKSFILLLHFLDLLLRFNIPGWYIHYYWVKCADIRFSGWFSSLPTWNHGALPPRPGYKFSGRKRCSRRIFGPKTCTLASGG